MTPKPSFRRKKTAPAFERDWIDELAPFVQPNMLEGGPQTPQCLSEHTIAALVEDRRDDIDVSMAEVEAHLRRCRHCSDVLVATCEIIGPTSIAPGSTLSVDLSDLWPQTVNEDEATRLAAARPDLGMGPCKLHEAGSTRIFVGADSRGVLIATVETDERPVQTASVTLDLVDEHGRRTSRVVGRTDERGEITLGKSTDVPRPAAGEHYRLSVEFPKPRSAGTKRGTRK